MGSWWVQGSRYKVHNVLDQDRDEYDASVAAIWDHAEKFDPKTERLFRYLQACPPVPFQNHACTFECALSLCMHAIMHALTSSGLFTDPGASEMHASGLTCPLPCAIYFRGDGARCEYGEKVSSGFE